MKLSVLSQHLFGKYLKLSKIYMFVVDNVKIFSIIRSVLETTGAKKPAHPSKSDRFFLSTNYEVIVP